MTLILNRRHFLGASALSAGLAASPAFANMPLAPKMAPWSPVTAALQSFIDKKYVPGAAAAIGRGTADADFLFTGALAFDNPAAVTADTLFRCYSMTKPITGMAAMMLIEDGKLKLDQNIADFIPGFANPMVMIDPAKSLEARPSRAPITVRNLMTHTAGLGYSIVTKGPLLDAYLKLGITPASASRTGIRLGRESGGNSLSKCFTTVVSGLL